LIFTKEPFMSRSYHCSILRLALFVIAFCWAFPAGAEEPSPNATQKALQELIDESWEFGLKEDPAFATEVGRNDWNDQLGRNTVKDFQRRLKVKQGFHERVLKIDTSQLPQADRINLTIFRRLLSDEIQELKFQSYLIPITNRWGFHIWFPTLPDQTPFRNSQDYENYIARLIDFSRFADEQMELMRAGAKRQWVLPAVVLEGYRGTVEPHIVSDPKKSLLYKPFRKYSIAVPEADRDRLSKAGATAIEKHVVPAYKKFLDFMENEYLPECRGTVGISAIPGGRAYYRHRVRKYTTLDITPEEVHGIGMSEVKRIRKQMDAIIKKVKFKGDFAEFVEFLRTSPQFYAKTPEELEKEVAYVLKKMDGVLPELFKTLPRTPYGVKRVPAYLAPRTTTAYYQPPPGDGTRAGFYFLNTYNLKSRPLYEVEALSLHEAVPGHHLQLALQQELPNIPEFRRFAGFTVFIEGWALYSERLGLEVGFYQDPYGDFGRLTYEMWRACRLVVDTGVHHLGWTRQQAIQFMADNTALSIHNITAEVDRYIAWPGQALAYKMGELKIRALRQKAEKELGAKFDIREFHEVVLGSGSVPLAVLEMNVNGYIAKVNSTQQP